MQLSTRLSRFSEPATLKMAKMGRELRAQGINITDLSLGEPDFDTPRHIKDAAIRAIEENWSHYSPVAGFPDLRQAVCHKLKRDNNLDYQPENIVISTGAKQSIANAVLGVVSVGDEVIIPTPYWVTYSALVGLGEGNVRLVKTTLQNGYKITPEQLEAAITPRTTLFMFSSPCNPTGATYTRDELYALARVFEKHPQVFVMSDEIYEYINYTGRHESIAQFDFIKEQVIIVNGLSKGFAMTGYRLGYTASSAAAAKAFEKLQGQFTSGTNTITQRAAITALTTDLQPTLEMVESFKRRRALTLQLAGDIPGFVCHEPEGAFYIFPDISAYFGKSCNGVTINNAEDFSMFLLHEAHVSTVGGHAFGDDRCIRISFANAEEKIREGFAKIRDAVARLA
jgi:aspartate aminotransferase